MELKIALVGGVLPALILALAMLLGALLTRAPSTRAWGAPLADQPRPLDPARHAARSAVFGALSWVAGLGLGVPLIHFASWSWPEVWPVDATARWIHTGWLVAGWSLVDVLLGALAAAGSGPDSYRRRWVVAAARWIGRTLIGATILAILLHAYLRVLGWPTVIGGVAAGTALVLISTLATQAAQHQRHPRLVWWAHFAAALAAVVVLILGRTATAAQAAAGLAAVAAATGVATLIVRRAAPGPVAGFAFSALLAWLLAIGCFATGKTNLASSVLILVAPVAWALPRRPLALDLFWKRLPIGTIVATLWTVTCVGAAIGVAAVTQDRPAPSGYEDYDAAPPAPAGDP